MADEFEAPEVREREQPSIEEIILAFADVLSTDEKQDLRENWDPENALWEYMPGFIVNVLGIPDPEAEFRKRGLLADL